MSLTATLRKEPSSELQINIIIIMLCCCCCLLFCFVVLFCFAFWYFTDFLILNLTTYFFKTSFDLFYCILLTPSTKQATFVNNYLFSRLLRSVPNYQLSHISRRFSCISCYLNIFRRYKMYTNKSN